MQNGKLSIRMDTRKQAAGTPGVGVPQAPMSS
jgi:hypothetical protein